MKECRGLKKTEGEKGSKRGKEIEEKKRDKGERSIVVKCMVND